MVMMAFLFPGQGSQYAGMGKELSGKYPEFRRVMEEADDTLKFSLSKLCFDGPDDQLKLTAITQPSILSVSTGIWEIMKRRAPLPHFAAGHSLGEYTALVSAGSLQFRDAVQTVKHRGEFMQEAVPEGRGSMAAILGLRADEVDDICSEASKGEIVSTANYNSPLQTVVAGEAGAVERVIELAGKRGAKRALKLQVSAPFHCALMKPAQEKLAAHLETLPMADLAFPIVTNVDARFVSESRQAKESLVRQVTAPVRWEQSMKLLRQEGTELLVEIGPKKVLSGLARQIDESFRICNVEDEKTLIQILKVLEPVRC